MIKAHNQDVGIHDLQNAPQGTSPTPMIERLKDPEFSLALGIGLLTLALFVYWLRTGGRKPR